MISLDTYLSYNFDQLLDAIISQESSLCKQHIIMCSDCHSDTFIVSNNAQFQSLFLHLPNKFCDFVDVSVSLFEFRHCITMILSQKDFRD